MSGVRQRFPSTDAVVVTGWTLPTQAYSNDGLYATAAPGKNLSVVSDYGTFGFDNLIPTGATITKVEILYEYKTSTTASIATMRVNGKVSSTILANHDDTSEPAADTLITVDITADRSWAVSDFTDANWSVRVSAIRGNSSTAVTFSMDYVSTKVTFSVSADSGSFTLTGTAITPSVAAPGSSGSFALTGSDVTLRQGHALAAGSGSFALSGTKAVLGGAVVPSSGSFALTGSAVTLRVGAVAGSGSFALTGSDATLTYTPGGPVAPADDPYGPFDGFSRVLVWWN